jgi:hypothetical protein
MKQIFHPKEFGLPNRASRGERELRVVYGKKFKVLFLGLVGKNHQQAEKIAIAVRKLALERTTRPVLRRRKLEHIPSGYPPDSWVVYAGRRWRVLFEEKNDCLEIITVFDRSDTRYCSGEK